jgi:hypothetical protein
MRVVDALLAIPFLFFIVLLASITTPTLIIIILAITAASWESTARLVRGEVLSLRKRDYVDLSQQLGARHHHVVFRHLVPNVTGTVVVTATLSMADAILIYAGWRSSGLACRRRPPTGAICSPPVSTTCSMATGGSCGHQPSPSCSSCSPSTCSVTACMTWWSTDWSVARPRLRDAEPVTITFVEGHSEGQVDVEAFLSALEAFA